MTSIAVPRPARRGGPTATLYRLMLRMTWRGGVIWSLVFAAFAASTVKGYEVAYKTEAARWLLGAQLRTNIGFHALYGVPYRIETVAGFTAWRIGTSMAVLAGVWMLLTATRLIRGEEEDGRWEFLLSGATTPARAVGAVAAAMASWLAVVWVVLTLTLARVNLPSHGSEAFAGGVVLVGAVFGAAALLSSQLVPIRRRASGLVGGTLGAMFIVRVVADTTTGLSWLRWVTPFGWFEEVRSYSGDRAGPLLLLAAEAIALAVVAFAIARRRDFGRGALFNADAAKARPAGLRSWVGFTARRSLSPTIVWSLSMGVFSLVLGLLARDVADFLKESPDAAKVLEKLGSSGSTATTFLGFVFGLVALVAALFTAFRVSADREEESSGRLDNLFVGPVDRRSWFLWQGLVTVAGAVVITVGSAAFAWLGAIARGADVSLPRLLEGGLNCLPVVVLFTGLGFLAFAAIPRGTTGVALGAIALSYLVLIVGSLIKAPRWVLDLSPFQHVPPVPATGWEPVSAAALFLIGVGMCLLGARIFARRDIAGP
jgi:polyether ionophore transport system permease protein